MIRTLSFRSFLYLGVGLVLAAGILSVMTLRASAATLGGQMDIGSRGDDVSTLQTFLAADPHIYPAGLVTGYFGPLTAAAVTQFQLYYGLDPVGRVGPLTLAKMNAMLAGNMKPDITAPALFNVSATSANAQATIYWSTNELAHGVVYYSTTPIVSYETSAPFSQPVVSGSSMQVDSTFALSHSVTITGLAPHTTYHYRVFATDVAGNVTASTEQVVQIP